jgi:hypothetical protein
MCLAKHSFLRLFIPPWSPDHLLLDYHLWISLKLKAYKLLNVRQMNSSKINPDLELRWVSMDMNTCLEVGEDHFQNCEQNAVNEAEV